MVIDARFAAIVADLPAIAIADVSAIADDSAVEIASVAPAVELLVVQPNFAMLVVQVGSGEPNGLGGRSAGLNGAPDLASYFSRGFASFCTAFCKKVKLFTSYCSRGPKVPLHFCLWSCYRMSTCHHRLILLCCTVAVHCQRNLMLHHDFTRLYNSLCDISFKLFPYSTHCTNALLENKLFHSLQDTSAASHCSWLLFLFSFLCQFSARFSGCIEWIISRPLSGEMPPQTRDQLPSSELTNLIGGGPIHLFNTSFLNSYVLAPSDHPEEPIFSDCSFKYVDHVDSAIASTKYPTSQNFLSAKIPLSEFVQFLPVSQI